MSNQIIEAEIVPDDKLVKYASETGLEKPATETLVHAFAPVFAKAREVLAGAAGVAASVKDATCVTEIRQSRTCRLAIRAVRLEGEAIHKKQKESALRFGKAVDGFRNILLADLAPVEQALQEAEDTAERAEAARKMALKAARFAELAPLLEGHPPLADLGELSEANYARILSDAKLLRQAKLDAIAKAEAERLAKIEADRLERERIAAENARLQAEAVEARRLADEERRVAAEQAAREVEKNKAALEAAAKKAKAEHDAMLKKLAEEQAARAKVQAKLEAKAKAEREAIEAKAQEEAAAKAKADADAKAAVLAARKAKAAPDKAKLLAFADVVAHLDVPTFADEATDDAVRTRVHALASWLAEEAVKL